VRPTLILASGSPRRRELLSSLGLPFTVCPPSVDETLRPEHPAEQEAVRLATEKAREAALRQDGVVVAADTLVAMGDEIFEKPKGPEEARAMLQRLRGREHRVVTGVVVANRASLWAGQRVTQVLMRSYTDAEIAEYIARGEPFDKAGGYAIQDRGFHPVERITPGLSGVRACPPDGRGCYCNVVGLPLGLLLALLRDAGYSIGELTQPPQCAGCPDW